MSIRIYCLVLTLLFLGSSCDTLGVYNSVNGCDLLPNTNCDDANLAGAFLNWNDLSGAQFQNADLRGALMSDSLFNNANFNGANLSGAIIDGAIFDGATCAGATWIDGTMLTENCIKETCREFYDFEATLLLTSSVINKRYRELVFVYHPDKGGTAEQFIRLQACRAELLGQV